MPPQVARDGGSRAYSQKYPTAARPFPYLNHFSSDMHVRNLGSKQTNIAGSATCLNVALSPPTHMICSAITYRIFAAGRQQHSM